MPIGVAALPIPSMLALIFTAIYFFAFCPALGNRKFIIGFNNFSNFCDNPAFSAIFIIPVQKHITPANDNTVKTALFAPSNAPFIVWSTVPLKIDTTIDTIIIKHQI